MASQPCHPPTGKPTRDHGSSIDYATLVLAAWCYYSDKGTSKDGNKLDIVDEMKEELHKAASATANDPLSFLKLKQVFGELIGNKTLTDKYSLMVNTLYKNPDIAMQMQKLI